MRSGTMTKALRHCTRVALVVASAVAWGTAFATVCIGPWHDPSGYVTQALSFDGDPGHWPPAVLATVAVDTGEVPDSALAVYDFGLTLSETTTDTAAHEPGELLLRMAPISGLTLRGPSSSRGRRDGLVPPFVSLLSMGACYTCERWPAIVEADYRVTSAFDDAVGGTVSVGFLDDDHGIEMAITYGDDRVVYSLGRGP